ncbi:hypothetical protein PILCRDRAFT_68330 [Piloderma croceum F 1598]|uniref:Thioredoxin domain-containing protein n=1 Tax=Piloderma croceum (strain F 1598) TaxID=765440 RepID=A0A0C3C3M9_PILCF|nr:hypothetical protein PILCRDRAFT_68330 [Piloderma croceum F 1598]
MGTNDDPLSESRSTRQCSSGSTDQDRLSNPTPRPQPKRNVLRARRGRSLSLSCSDATLPPAKPGNLSQQKALASPQLATDSSQRTLSDLLQTSPCLTSPGRRTRSHSQQLTSLVRPATAPAASVTSVEENRKPTQKQLSEAASLLVIAESGVRVSFGDLFLARKTVVIFIRHFWCPNCQDYMSSISNTVSPAALKQAGIKLVIISNGSHNIIQSYRKIFHTPFAVYTDPTHRVYNALGMTLRTLDTGPESRKGAYAKHGVAQGIAMVLLNAIKSKMPLLGKGGDVEQLGGEFVLGPG